MRYNGIRRFDCHRWQIVACLFCLIAVNFSPYVLPGASQDLSAMGNVQDMARGVFVDADGEPIEGVELEPFLFAQPQSSLANKTVLRSDSQGRWAWDVSKHPNVFALRTSKNGYLPHEVRLDLPEPQRIQLSIANSMRGYVVDSQDREVEGAVVLSVQNGSYFAPAPIHTTKSDNRGWFELANVPSAGISLRAVLPTGDSGYLNNLSSNSTKLPVVELTPPVPLNFVVVDEQGVHVEKARITLGSWNHSGAIRWSGHTDHQGQVSWPNAPMGLLVFEVQKEDFYTTWVKYDCNRPMLQTIVLASKSCPSTRVVDDETGNPIDHFVVKFTRQNLNPNPVADSLLAEWNSNASLPDNAVLGTHGSFCFRSIPFFDFIEIELVALGYKSLKFRLDRNHENESIRELRLKKPDAARDITLLNPDGQPAHGANVVFVPQGIVPLVQSADPLIEFQRWPDRAQQHVVNNQAIFQFIESPTYNFFAAWNERGYAFGTTNPLPPENSIKLLPYSKLRVRLPADELRKRFRKFEVRRQILKNNLAFRSSVSSPCEIDLVNNILTCDRVPSGEIVLVQKTFDSKTRKLITQELAEMTLKPESTREIVMDGTGCIRGQVKFPDARLIKAWPLECIATSCAPENSVTTIFSRVVNSEGVLELNRLPPGEYALRFAPVSRSDSNPKSGPTAIHISSNAPKTIVLESGQFCELGDIVLSVAK